MQHPEHVQWNGILGRQNMRTYQVAALRSARVGYLFGTAFQNVKPTIARAVQDEVPYAHYNVEKWACMFHAPLFSGRLMLWVRALVIGQDGDCSGDYDARVGCLQEYTELITPVPNYENMPVADKYWRFSGTYTGSNFSYKHGLSIDIKSVAPLYGLVLDCSNTGGVAELYLEEDIIWEGP